MTRDEAIRELQRISNDASYYHSNIIAAAVLALVQPEEARCDCGKTMEACAENAYIAFGGSSNKPAPPETGSVYWTPSQIRTERWHSEQRFVTAADYDTLAMVGRGYVERAEQAQAEVERLRAANVRLQEALVSDPTDQSAEIDELRKIVEAVKALPRVPLNGQYIRAADLDRALEGEK